LKHNCGPIVSFLSGVFFRSLKMTYCHFTLFTVWFDWVIICQQSLFSMKNRMLRKPQSLDVGRILLQFMSQYSVTLGPLYQDGSVWNFFGCAYSTLEMFVWTFTMWVMHDHSLKLKCHKNITSYHHSLFFICLLWVCMSIYFIGKSKRMI
jgi:hypothetical protein